MTAVKLDWKAHAHWTTFHPKLSISSKEENDPVNTL